MSLSKHYKPAEYEPNLVRLWEEQGVHRFDRDAGRPVYSIDSPPPTVSGYLHLGHVYSYSHADFMARFFRMNGYNVFYPMGFDDNGLPTERLVEKRLHITATQVGRQAFIQKCLEISEEAEKEYRSLWDRLGLSIDWRYSYRTIDRNSRREAQLSFLDLHRRGLIYRQQSPVIWCPECRSAFAQADVDDLEQNSEFVTLPFGLPNGRTLPIATTRPELLSACVAVFVHVQDVRYTALIGGQARVPFYGQSVPIMADAAADPQKGTGAVMCCTFGDQTDIAWWQKHRLPLAEAIDRSGRMTELAGALEGMTIPVARQEMKTLLEAQGLLLERTPIVHMMRVHERCDTPIEYISTPQWFIRVIDQKDELIKAGAQVNWHPEYMGARYRAWVENMNWDWCISRQRYFGVPFPTWFCKTCGEVILAEEEDLPIDPLFEQPRRGCACGSTEFVPDTDIMDTWATSSLSPQIVTQRLDDPHLHRRTYPMSLRPQAHDIIRTWAFYTIAKSWLHTGSIPWKDALISGWGLAGEGVGKISKSRGGGPVTPLEMIQRYSADAVRYWAASSSPGKDSIINEEKFQAGGRLVTKLWNVARFSQPFLTASMDEPISNLTPADRWILASLTHLVRQVTADMLAYEYANAKNNIELFFWHNLADNYIEMAKQRLYAPQAETSNTARYCLSQALLTTIKLLAPFLPYITEVIYQELFAIWEGFSSIHLSAWAQPMERFESTQAEKDGELLVAVASAARRFKSEGNIGLGTELNLIQLAAVDAREATLLSSASADLLSVTRARRIEIVTDLSGNPQRIVPCENIQMVIQYDPDHT
jgi:valyl-tRNA synthetase